MFGLIDSLTGILTSFLGTECPYQCRLSFLCWLDGGHHRIGCGNNKWLFSCCETNDVYRRPMQKIHLMPKSVPKNLIRRRIDFTDESFNSNCGVPHNAENILQKRIIGGRQVTNKRNCLAYCLALTKEY